MSSWDKFGLLAGIAGGMILGGEYGSLVCQGITRPSSPMTVREAIAYFLIVCGFVFTVWADSKRSGWPWRIVLVPAALCISTGSLVVGSGFAPCLGDPIFGEGGLLMLPGALIVLLGTFIVGRMTIIPKPKPPRSS